MAIQICRLKRAIRLLGSRSVQGTIATILIQRQNQDIGLVGTGNGKEATTTIYGDEGYATSSIIRKSNRQVARCRIFWECLPILLRWQ